MRHRRGRPRLSEGPAVTREQIIEAALSALRSNGMRGLSLREIARQLNVTLPTIQRHFATKNDLWRACVDNSVAQLPLVKDPHLPQDPKAVLSGHLRGQIERAFTFRMATATMWNDRDEGGTDRIEYLTDRLKPVVISARERLSLGMDLGLFRRVDQDVVIAIIALGISSLSVSPMAMDKLFNIDITDPDVQEHLVDELTDLLLHGLLNNKSSGATPEE
ncbi:MAG: TetR/AcrR family transcriptional regulator [Candidatus Dormibacteria bacterium]